MEHGSYEVDVLNASGELIGKKKREDINKRHDIFKAAHILMITPSGEVVLTRIKRRTDLPNNYPGHFGATIATIIRSGEISEEAARRAVSRELFIDNGDVHFVGEAFETELRDKKPAFLAFFYIIGDPPRTYSKTDIGDLITFSPNDLSRQVVEHPDEFCPKFCLLWEKYSDQLPI